MTVETASDRASRDCNQPAGRDGLPARRRSGARHLVPSSFEERGCTVPFTTPALAHARVRKDWRGRLELGVGHFWGGAGAYVMPWEAVKDLVPLTVHDLLLHDVVPERRALDPHAVRLASFEVAASGLAGPEMAESARRLIKADEESLALNQVMLVLRLTQECGTGALVAGALELKSDATRERVAGVLHEVARALGAEPQRLDERIGALGVATHAVGMAWSPDAGRLRRRLARLGDFQDDLARWSDEHHGDGAGEADFAVEVARHTIAVGRAVLAGFDAATASVRAVLDDWDRLHADIAAKAGRLDWLLDGWSALMDPWFACADDQARRESLGEIASHVPLVPRSEQAAEAEPGTDALSRPSRRRVKANVDWRSGEVDVELVRRIERMRAEARAGDDR